MRSRYKKNALVIFLSAFSFLLLGGFISPSETNAGVVIHGTRIIYPAKKNEVNVRVENRDKEKPALTQVWIDDGTGADIEAAEGFVPFVIAPPLVRIEAKSTQSFRIFKLPDLIGNLDKDIESIFYFNLMDIPTKDQTINDDVGASLQVSFTSKIKLFYRPEGLAGEPGKAAAQVVWEISNEKNKKSIVAKNPTAYHVTFSDFVVNYENSLFSVEPRMLSPKSNVEFQLLPLNEESGYKEMVKNGEVFFRWINDLGAWVDNNSKLFLQ